jgi:hypothetical protein
MPVFRELARKGSGRGYDTISIPSTIHCIECMYNRNLSRATRDTNRAIGAKGKIVMTSSNMNVEGLELVVIGSDEFAGLSTYQQSYLMGRGLDKAISSQDQIIEMAALITFGGNTEPPHADWIAYRDGAIAGHQEEVELRTGVRPERGPIAANKDAQKDRAWFSRHVKKPLVAYWAAQDPAREFVVPLKNAKVKKPLTKLEKQAAKVEKEEKKLLDIGVSKARDTRDALIKIVSETTRNLVDALRTGDAKTIKSAKAKLDRLEKAINKIAK